MKFDPTTRTLTLERKDCRTCTHGAGEQGQYTGTKVCPTCKGTGNGPRGGKGKCRDCYGGKQHDFDNPIVCPTCHGDFKDAALETFTDYCPTEAVDAMPMIFVVLDRDNTWNEEYLGLGTVYSVTDYGDRWRRASKEIQAVATRRSPGLRDLEDIAQELMAEARESVGDGGHLQACKITKSYERGDQAVVLHDTLVYTLTHTGYQVRAMSDLPENFEQNSIAEKQGARA